MAVGVDFSHSTDGVEGERVGADADDRAWLYLSTTPPNVRRGRYLLRTILLVVFELNVMPISFQSLISSHPICEPSEQWSGKFGERVQR